MERTCNICGAPWHPASGHYISETMVWCGPCTKSWVKEVAGMQKRRWGGLKFYDHATVPQPAEETSYNFMIDVFTPVEGKPHTSTVMCLRSRGVTVEEAYLKIAEQIPAGHRMWCYTTDEYWTERKNGDKP